MNKSKMNKLSNDLPEEEEALRMIRQEAANIIGWIDHLHPQIAVGSVESAFIFLLNKHIVPEKRLSSLKGFVEHANSYFKMMDNEGKKE